MRSRPNKSAKVCTHRYNLAQVQGVLYRASELIITAYRNDPGEYKLLFRYLKLFGLMTFIEGDADHGYTITIDGPASLFGASTRYGVDLAKFLPALLHVSRWEMVASLTPRILPDGRETPNRFTLDAGSGLVSHYKKGNVFDSIIEESFAASWARTKTGWRLEREVELVPLPGSVMVPDFRLVHPDGRTYVLELDRRLLAAGVPQEEVLAGCPLGPGRHHPAGVGPAEPGGCRGEGERDEGEGGVVQGQGAA